MFNLRIERTDLGSPVAITLIEALNAELNQLYPEEGANHFRLDPGEVAPGRGIFLVAYVEGDATGCGGLRRLNDAEAEVKRMYTIPARRGQGIARAILAALETEARALGVSRIVLETGIRQPEAIGLYSNVGFSPVPLFGEYTDSPLSVCMAKSLT